MLDFIAIDFETANYNAHSACSVGLVRYQDGVEVDSFYSLIKPPELYFIPDFIDIHGITPDMVADAPQFDEVWEAGILHFLNNPKYSNNVPFVAHNAGFDMKVLRECLTYFEIPIPNAKSICTLQMARKAWKFLPKHNLPYLAIHYNIIYDAHNALDDARTCAQLLAMAAKEKGVNSTDALLKKLKFFAKPLQQL